MCKEKKFNYIYRITCTITNKFYIGMHSTDYIDDGYLGSGLLIRRSCSKYGDENHIKEILEFCSSRLELQNREREIVNEEMLSHPQNIYSKLKF